MYTIIIVAEVEINHSIDYMWNNIPQLHVSYETE